MGLFSFCSNKKTKASNNNYEKMATMNWLRRNSIKLHEDIIKKTLKHFQIREEDYQLVANGYGDLDILITFKTDRYKIQINEDQKTYNLLKYNFAFNKKGKEKYHHICSFEGDDLIYDTLKYLTNNKSN